MILVFLAGTLLLSECKSDERASSDAGLKADAGADTALAGDAGIQDAGKDGGSDAAPRACNVPPAAGETFDLDPEGRTTQIHPNAAFDGEAIWVAYNRPKEDGSGYFDVFAMRLACDGARLLPPFKVNTTEGRNDVDPDVEIGGGNVYIAWLSDSGVFPDNLDVFFRTFDVNGSPIMQADRVLEPSRKGAPVTGNIWMPAIAPLAGGKFVIAGAWGIDEAQSFQVFIQKAGSDGVLEGEAYDAFLEHDCEQTAPAVAATADGTLYAAWTRAKGEDEEGVVFTKFAPGSQTADPSPPAFALPGRRTTAASLAYAAGNGGAVYLAFNTSDGADSKVILRSGSSFGEDAPFLEFDTPGRIDHTASVAAGEGGGAVAWYRNIRGFRNEVLVQGFSFDGTSFEKKGDPLVLNDEDHPAAPYQPAITRVAGNIYLVVWSEGQSPDLRLKGRLVER